jgi:hypothetical protein
MTVVFILDVIYKLQPTVTTDSKRMGLPPLYITHHHRNGYNINYSNEESVDREVITGAARHSLQQQNYGIL